jgi:hypothetical protein
LAGAWWRQDSAQGKKNLGFRRKVTVRRSISFRLRD